MKVHLELLKFSTAAVPAGLLLAALFNPQSAFAQQATVSTDYARMMTASVETSARPATGLDASPAPARDEEQPSKAKRHGIQIHGHWVIDVRNPDGKLVEHRDFENSLVTGGSLLSGDQMLGGLISGNFAAGDSGIGLVQGTPATDPSAICNTSLPLLADGTSTTAPTPNTNCFGLTTATSGMTGYLANFTSGLTSTVTFSPTVKWVLSGNFVTPASLTTISAVQTLIGTCFNPHASFVHFIEINGETVTGIQYLPATGRSADVSSAACMESSSLPLVSLANIDNLLFTTFTSTNLATPLAVSAGQVITVTVTISFT